MKRLALSLVLTSLFAFTVAADDGQIPIGGRSGTCNPGVQCHSMAPNGQSLDTPDNADLSPTEIGGVAIIEALRTMGLM